MTTAAKLLAVMAAELGVAEFPGADSNPRILEYRRVLPSAPAGGDEVNWCSIFIAWAVKRIGLPLPAVVNTTAQSWLKYGTPIQLGLERPGDIIIWKRPPESWTGHVGAIESVLVSGERIVVLNANVGNKVARTTYNLEREGPRRVLGIRRPPYLPLKVPPPKKEPFWRRVRTWLKEKLP